MTEFTASNGITVANHGGNWDQTTIHFTGEAHTVSNERDMRFEDCDLIALEEFFQHKRDDELGRWRDPQFPEFVAYWHPVLSKLTVIWEPQGGSTEFKRDDVPPPGSGGLPAAVAHAYFDAHPEPKPWRDANPGELWSVKTSETGPANLALLTAQGWIWAVTGHEIKQDFTAGRRIWPEATS